MSANKLLAADGAVCCAKQEKIRSEKGGSQAARIGGSVLNWNLWRDKTLNFDWH